MNWIEVFDLIASEYGWTFDEFKKVTLRTLQGCLEMIDIRTHNDFVKQASLKGIKLEFKRIKRQVKDYTDDQKRMMAEVTKAAAQRKLLEKAAKARKKQNGNNK